ncbi:hypothetical protein DDP54_03780 [Cellulomonas sp. WB94]|uniref:hypothetical protein n=1 Tax=Cellulomonas sp. WB94 TaxID=2173174 RepID=UPI000D581F52|nr:hypothetical protein [Cellulomonas sp. WB94]PVU82265.1 hypothetical protein DDP54_03780 [Cellulomonas sp. WB94]
MKGRTWLVLRGLIAVALAVTLVTYNDAGDLSISNESSTEVTVITGDTEAIVPATGGTVLLDYGCTPGDVTVKVASGPAVVVPGPVCPEQQIVIRGDGKVELQPASANTT